MTPFKTEQEEMGNSICLDFDLVLNSYRSGWLGDDIIPDPPYPKAREAVYALRESGWTVKVHSVRCRTEAGRDAIMLWLIKHEIVVDEVCEHKPAAHYYVDDRAIRFNGSWEDALAQIKELHRNGGK